MCVSPPLLCCGGNAVKEYFVSSVDSVGGHRGNLSEMKASCCRRTKPPVRLDATRALRGLLWWPRKRSPCRVRVRADLCGSRRNSSLPIVGGTGLPGAVGPASNNGGSEKRLNGGVASRAASKDLVFPRVFPRIPVTPAWHRNGAKKNGYLMELTPLGIAEWWRPTSGAPCGEMHSHTVDEFLETRSLSPAVAA